MNAGDLTRNHIGKRITFALDPGNEHPRLITAGLLTVEHGANATLVRLDGVSPRPVAFTFGSKPERFILDTATRVIVEDDAVRALLEDDLEQPAADLAISNATSAEADVEETLRHIKQSLAFATVGAA